MSDPPDKYLTWRRVKFEDLKAPLLTRDDLLLIAERIATLGKDYPDCRLGIPPTK